LLSANAMTFMLIFFGDQCNFPQSLPAKE